ncbi:MAG: hypothetical protein OCC49_17095 [Fibrobacterales bacterium]
MANFIDNFFSDPSCDEVIECSFLIFSSRKSKHRRLYLFNPTQGDYMLEDDEDFDELEDEFSYDHNPNDLDRN